MQNEIMQEFVQKEKRLIDLCTEIAGILRQSDRWSGKEADDLESIARNLPLAQTIEGKRDIVSRIKDRFQKEGVFDWGPSDMNWKDWRAKTDELYDLVWIYQESKYSSLWRK